MALLFCEGFDDGLSAQKWPLADAPETPAGSGRGGGLAAFMDGAPDFIRRALPSAASTFIIGFAFKINSSPSGSIFFMARGDAGATWHISLAVAPSGAILVYRANSTILITSSILTQVGVWHYIELKSTIADAGGTHELRIDGKVAGTFTGDTKNGGTATSIDMIDFERSTGAAFFYVDDLYVCDGTGAVNNDFLGDIKVETLYPNGNGNSSQLLGSDADSVDNYLLIDETIPSTTDYVSSGTVGQKDTYTFTNLATATGPIKGVQLTSYANKTDAGARDIINVTRSGGVEADSATKSLQTTYNAYLSIQETNPNGGGAWTITDVNNAEFGVKVN